MTTSGRRTLRGFNPVYVMLGATDLAAQKLREIGANAIGESADDAADAKTQWRRFARGARQLPLLALNETLDVVVRTQSQYADLAERGVRVIKRQPQVQHTEDLLHRAQETASRGQAAASRAAQSAAGQTRGRANSALSSARHQADEVVEAVNHVAQVGRSNAPALLRRGSVARPVRGVGAAVAGKAGAPVADTDSERPKPRRPRLSAGNTRAKVAEEENRRNAVAAGAGIEAGATVPTTKKSPTKPAKTAKPEGADKAKPTPKRPTRKKSTASSESSRTTVAAAASNGPATKSAQRRRTASASAEPETAETTSAIAPAAAQNPESTTPAPELTTNAPSGTDA